MTRLPRVQIVVRNPGNCRVLEAGARMVYDHPEILAKRTCAQAVSLIAPIAEGLARASGAGGHNEPEELICPVEDCGAVFLLRALSLSEMARQGQAPTPSRRRPAAAAATVRRGGFLKWAVVSLVVGLVAVVLCAGAFAGLVFLAPERLPSGLRERLGAWGVPVGRVEVREPVDAADTVDSEAPSLDAVDSGDADSGDASLNGEKE